MINSYKRFSFLRMKLKRWETHEIHHQFSCSHFGTEFLFYFFGITDDVNIHF